MIVYAWVNDRDTLRKAGAGTDPYAVFARMLANGRPPDDWPALLAAVQRFDVPIEHAADRANDEAAVMRWIEDVSDTEGWTA